MVARANARTLRRTREEQTEGARSYRRCPVHGVALVAEAAGGIVEWLSTWTLARVEAGRLVDSIEGYARIYLGMRIVAEASSARSVQENLTRARNQSRKLISALDQLDGNSLRILTATAGREDPVAGLRNALTRTVGELSGALDQVKNDYGGSGPRRQDARYQFAALIADAVRKHTSASVTGKANEMFESTLRYVFSLSGDHRANLEALAQTVIQSYEVVQDEGITHVGPK